MAEKTQYPLISVIVPIYNVEGYLKKCIDSLLNQDYDNFELLLVNDCSTDNSLQIAQKYVDAYPDKCIIVCHDTNRGLSAARNSGISYAKGEWITFVDSDDWVLEDYLSTLYDTAMTSKSDIVIGGVVYAYDNGTTRSADSYGNLKSGAAKKEIIAQCRSYACGRLFRRSLFTESNIAFPEDIRRSEDVGTVIPLFTRASRIAILEKNVYFYYQRSTSLSLSNKQIDLSFYPKTVNRMLDLSIAGYEKELEFRCIHELLYGMVFLMVISNRSRREFVNHIDRFTSSHKEWQSNPYINELPKAKRIFIKFAENKQYLMLKLLVFAKNTLTRIGI